MWLARLFKEIEKSWILIQIFAWVFILCILAEPFGKPFVGLSGNQCNFMIRDDKNTLWTATTWKTCCPEESERNWLAEANCYIPSNEQF